MVRTIAVYKSISQQHHETKTAVRGSSDSKQNEDENIVPSESSPREASARSESLASQKKQQKQQNASPTASQNSSTSQKIPPAPTTPQCQPVQHQAQSQQGHFLQWMNCVNAVMPPPMVAQLSAMAGYPPAAVHYMFAAAYYSQAQQCHGRQSTLTTNIPTEIPFNNPTGAPTSCITSPPTDDPGDDPGSDPENNTKNESENDPKKDSENDRKNDPENDPKNDLENNPENNPKNDHENNPDDTPDDTPEKNTDNDPDNDTDDSPDNDPGDFPDDSPDNDTGNELSNTSRPRHHSGKYTKWVLRFNELKAYKKQHGNCNVPKRFPANPALGIWVSNQRSRGRLLREGRPSHITPRRMEQLESIGFEWHSPGGPSSRQEDMWNLRYNELDAYRKEKGNCRVPTKSYLPNPALGQWVNDQRRQYRFMNKGKASSMTRERIDKLEAIGFEWSPPMNPHVEDHWNHKFEQLVAYHSMHGHCIVPRVYDINPALGRWVCIQRREYHSFVAGQPSILDHYKINKLIRLGFVFNSDRKNRSRRINRTNSPLINPTSNSMKLKSNNVSHSTSYPNSTNEPKLEIEGTDTPYDDVHWLQHFEDLRAFFQRHGNCQIPAQSPQFQQLSRFVQQNKMDYVHMLQGKATGLTKERMDLLSQLKFPWPFLGGDGAQEHNDPMAKRRDGVRRRSLQKEIVPTLKEKNV